MNNQISINSINLIIEKGWTSWDDVENEIERIREDFKLLESSEIYDEAYAMFSTIYCVSILDLKEHMM